MKIVRRILLVLHIMIGVGATFAGFLTILNPQGPLGMPTDALQNSPFKDYLIPGIILFTVNGLGNLFCAATILLKSKYQGYISSVFGWALVIWIIVQCIMINMVVFLHVLYFFMGLIIAVSAAVILFKQNQFPANIAIILYKRIVKKNA